ncbi:hypothetical protein SARC_03830 [Sphaeroforma arctica JP610]|uniref:Uncharacterized protein n=1 Tax=Sphaeroforma arctica JP610 TaxID=667725 RepID=A0A0L0G535_9EUKA|nr:hypothetical protein SARC_03830 [Sphaeroforma arctica JP610]KNC83936.1 hypothetical protein SARC_03830 [Sphaeroforma arctica JP610]|eukprot:XP_014157838.1 hypothetical protein SARC_03830 [Sphaeroforma arctica JP610]
MRSRRGSMAISYTAKSRAPLIAAVKSLKTSEVERLLDSGEDINQTFKEHTGEVRTPLHWAVWLEKEKMVRLLLERGSDPNVPDQDQASPLHIAAAFAQPEMMKLLLDHKADVNIPGQRNWTALHDAAFGGATNVIELLLQAGADINSRNLGKDTPLHSAVAQDMVEAANLLLTSGACPHLRNWDNMRPIDIVNTRIAHSRSAAAYLQNEASAIERERQKLADLQEQDPEADVLDLPQLPQNIDERVVKLNATIERLQEFAGVLQKAMDTAPIPLDEELALLDLRLRQLKGLQYRLNLQMKYNSSLAEKLRSVVAQMG